MKIDYKIISIAFLLFFTSCNWSQSDSEEIIERDQFVLMLVDLHLADVLLAQSQLFDHQLADTSGKKSYYNYIFKKYNTNEYKFSKTVEYYARHNAEYYDIYSEVIDELSKKRAEMISSKEHNAEQNNSDTTIQKDADSTIQKDADSTFQKAVIRAKKSNIKL
jgi:hypothetical protein